jgi:peptidyl-prolyl cis-trans isomerase D
MAIFNEINKHSKVVGIFIGVGLLFFILGNEFFGQNSIFSRSKTDVGAIAGNSISYNEYQERLAQSEMDYQIRTGKAVTENERSSVHEFAWSQLVNKYVVEKEYEKLGLAVTDAEVIDMVQGVNIHPTVKQLFTNPQTQQFDNEFLKNFLKNFDKQEPRNQQLWTNIEKSLPTERIRNKYFNLLKKTNYVTNLEAKREYESQNTKRDIAFVYINNSSIADSLVQVSDDEIKAYIKNNPKLYEVEEGRSIDYVTFNIVASSKDSAAIQQELAAITNEFKTTDNDSIFVSNNSDSPVQPSYKSVSELPEEIKAFNLVKDTVYGPFLQNGKYSLYKIIGTKNDSLFAMKASHILFKEDPSKGAEAKADAAKRANEVLAKLKSGASFEQMASMYGTDGTASRGGDLGWFTEGQMVKPFNDAVLNAASTGLIPKLVETTFGYHIIKVTAPKTNKKFLIASIEREIAASEETKDAIFKKADEFSAQNKDTASFNAALAKDKNLLKYSAANFKKTDNYVSSLPSPKELIRWAYDDASIGQVSKVFVAENMYYVAALTGKREKGLSSVEEVRFEVNNKIKVEKKGQMILEKLKTLSGSLEKIAKDYGTGANYSTASGMNLSAGSIAGLGYEPIAVGTAMGTAKGKRSAPFVGDNGVGIIEVSSEMPAPEVAEHNSFKATLKQSRTGREDYVVEEYLRKQAKIEDNRYKFF